MLKRFRHFYPRPSYEGLPQVHGINRSISAKATWAVRKYEQYENSKQTVGFDSGDIKRSAKSVFAGGKVTKYDVLPKTLTESFKQQLSNAPEKNQKVFDKSIAKSEFMYGATKNQYVYNLRQHRTKYGKIRKKVV